MENKFSFAKDLIASCSVPLLKVDLDNTPIDANDFDEHRKLLDNQLPLLFDFIHQNEEWLCSNEENDKNVEIKGRLLILSSEITAHNTLYKIRNEQFLEVFHKFTHKSFYKILHTTGVEDFIFSHYTQYLKADVWKRHIGTVHGFSRFLELKSLGSGGALSIKWANFSLSVGLTLRECHLPEYKELSTTLFQAILSHSDPKEIKEVNIPGVIFDAVLKSVRSVETVEGTYAVWKCLCDCLDFNENTDSWDWDMTDEMMENLLGSLKHATSSAIVICLLSFIPKVLLRCTENRQQIEEFLAHDFCSLTDEVIERFRLACDKISSCTSYRWALYILKLFMSESHKFMESPSTCEKMMQRFHVCYLTTIYIIPVELMNINLLKFFEQFSNILVEAIATHCETPRIRQLVRQIYQTFIKHLEKSDLEDATKDFQQYHRAFKQFIDEQCC